MGKKSKKVKPETKKVIPQVTPQYPPFHKHYLWIGFTATFVIQFIVYLLSLAPSVTFEDSGELVAATYSLGVPHQPGYPLFTLIGKLFTYLPIGSIAFRVNLMSAFFSAFAVGLLYTVILYLIDELTVLKNKNDGAVMPGNVKYILAVPLAIFTGFTPSYYSQALITEVYGINNFFTVLILFLILRWYRVFNQSKADNSSSEKRLEKYFLGYALVCGLTLANHHTSLVFLPLGLFFIFIVNRGFLMDMKRLLKWAGCFFAGLSPYLYLPAASATNPPVDWGNPENWTNFWRVVTRHQYGLDLSETRSLSKFASQIRLHYELFFEQFGLVMVILGVAGLIGFWIYRKPVLLLSLVFALLTGPLVAYVTNVNMTVGDPFAVAEQRGLVSVMYLPFYLMWGGLAGAGMFMIAGRLYSKIPRLSVIWILIAISGLYTGWAGYQNYKKENMSDYYYVDRLFSNLEKIAAPNSVILANWDPFAFPPLYYQFVEKRFQDMIFIDIELLRRTWYLEMLINNYPQYMSYSKKEVDEFISAVRPFEEKEKFDPNFIQSKYIAMINSFVDYHYWERPVYLMVYYPIRPLEQGIAPGYRRESCFIAQRLLKPEDSIPDIDYRQFDFSDFEYGSSSRDRMSDMLRNYYAILFAEKAIAVSENKTNKALEYFDRSLELAESPVIRKQIQQLRQAVKQKRLPGTR